MGLVWPILSNEEVHLFLRVSDCGLSHHVFPLTVYFSGWEYTRYSYLTLVLISRGTESHKRQGGLNPCDRRQIKLDTVLKCIYLIHKAIGMLYE